MLETILIVVGIYLAIGSFITGICSKDGNVQFAFLSYMMFLWPFVGVALLGSILRMLHEHLRGK
tara:strand:- start:22050 stop:22241 length:192 start_codon:yes stop_codon:yes gene_type:complete